MNKWIVFGILWLSSAAGAHEFWMTPDRFSPPADAPVKLSLRVGEGFLGEPVAFGQPMAISLRWYSQHGKTDMTPQLPASLDQGSVAMAFTRPGSQVIALDTKPILNNLPADKFEDYLREDGLEHVIAQRKSSGQSASPGRERYRRHVKTLLQVADKPDATFGVRTGQTLEIVPLRNPQLLKSGDLLSVEVLFNGAPLQGALVRLWNRRGEQFDVLTARTDASGKITAALPWGGVWMVSAVHMVSATDVPGVDWDSHWANLTFEMSDPR